MKIDILRTLKHLSYLINDKKNDIRLQKEKMEQNIIQVYEGDDTLSPLGVGFVYKVELDDTVDTIDDSHDELLRLFTINRNKRIGNYNIGYPVDTKTFLSLNPEQIEKLDKYLFYYDRNNLALLFKITSPDNPQYLNIEGSRYFYNDFMMIEKDKILLRRTMDINCESDKKISDDYTGDYLITYHTIEKIGALDKDDEEFLVNNTDPKTKTL